MRINFDWEIHSHTNAERQEPNMGQNCRRYFGLRLCREIDQRSEKEMVGYEENHHKDCVRNEAPQDRGWSTPRQGVVHPKTGGGPPQDRGWSSPRQGVVHPKTGVVQPKTGGGPAIVQPWYVDTVLDIPGE